jgi:hypothetical protein
MSSLPRLNITLRQKVALSAVFGLGFFLIAVEIVRFRVIIAAVTNIPHILVWNYVSAWTGVVLASLPILRPLVFKRGYLGGGRESLRIGSPNSRDSGVLSTQFGNGVSNYPLKETVGGGSIQHVETGVPEGSESQEKKEVSVDLP